MKAFLQIKWTVSRGRDTCGYNIVTLTDTSTGEKYRTDGGGYDMTGTVVGHWLSSHFQKQLKALDISQFYGARRLEDGGIYLDGACGLECMLSIAKAIGIQMQSVYIKRKLIGFIVENQDDHQPA
jgi:hypothetical protein